MKDLQTLKLEYEDYLRNQRGLSEKSIYDCWRFADRFLNFRFEGEESRPVEDNTSRYRAIHAAPHLARETVSRQNAADASA